MDQLAVMSVVLCRGRCGIRPAQGKTEEEAKGEAVVACLMSE